MQHATQTSELCLQNNVFLEKVCSEYVQMFNQLLSILKNIANFVNILVCMGKHGWAWESMRDMGKYGEAYESMCKHGWAWVNMSENR